MSQTGTPTEFLKLGITEPDDTLNVLVDLNGQWQKIDTGVKNVDTKANTNASGISALNTAVQDNTENITNILETNVNQQTSIDTLQSKVATLEEDDTSYGSRITAVEAGVQENSELINDLKVDLSGVKTSVGTVPSGSNLQGEVNGLDTRVTALENSGSVAAVEARVTTLETEVGTVPAGETVQGQITTLNGQVNSGNIPFRFSVDGGGNYGYLKADDSFVPFRSGSGDTHWHKLDTTIYSPHSGLLNPDFSFIIKYVGHNSESSPNYRKIHDLINNVDYTVPGTRNVQIVGRVVYESNLNNSYVAKNGTLNHNTNTLIGVIYDNYNKYTHYLTKNGNNLQYNVVDVEGNTVGLPVNFTIRGLTAGHTTAFNIDNSPSFSYVYDNKGYKVTLNSTTGQATETESTDLSTTLHYYLSDSNGLLNVYYDIKTNGFSDSPIGYTTFDPCPNGVFLYHMAGKYYYYI